jgi:arylsulfatase A-like enzyme
MARRNDGSGFKAKKLIDAALAGGGVLSQEVRKLAERSAADRGMAGMNVVMFITDQDRAIQHFPKGWAEKNLPGATRLARNGVTFQNAFTNSCMCSPARATLMTGYFPAQHGVRYTLEVSMSDATYPQVEMPLELANLASVMSAAGYNVVYKGKWHLNKPANGVSWVPSDVGQYGFTRWNPQDAGANQQVSEAGGGSVNNDGRFINDDGDMEDGDEGALAYLGSAAAQQQPFFMIISLVNPHDVLFYPGSSFAAAGYDDSWLEGDIEPPATADEDLFTKPSVQKQFLHLMAAMGVLDTPQKKRDYLNFYGNLMISSDQYLVNVLDTLESTGLIENTVVIRTADHGEMGLAHGGLRQKNFNFYEESLRVPLVFSNPKLFPHAQRTDALVSHVDLLPTLATLFGAPDGARAPWQGVDYSRTVLHPETTRAPQDYVVFTWDDWQAGQPNGPYLPPPNHIVSIREQRWKLAEYYDADGHVPSQWEMYDLKHDPLEMVNLCWDGYVRTPEQEAAFRRLRRKLATIRKTRLTPLPTTVEWEPAASAD